jgi:hypothetical protein
LTCPNCHRTFEELWKGIKRCFYCGVLLITIAGPISPQQPPSPELRYFAAAIVDVNTNTASATGTWLNKSG